jgi:hypothetical protein
LLFCFEMVSYVAQAGLELEILLLQPPKCWDLQVCTTIPSPISFVLFFPT